MPPAVPVNLITGFLGVGKTTAIQHLLNHKPANQRWAVLVNEFGEVGIDGSLLNQTAADGGHRGQRQQEIFIRELPGGCMCCTMGLPMQVALNQLLAQARPDRLLIEPTGLGHPQQIVNMLNQPHYHSIVATGATLTLLDPRKISDTRYTSNALFRQQLDCADLIVANKSDLCSNDALSAMHSWLARHYPYTAVITVQHGRLDPDSLSAVLRTRHAGSAAQGPAAHQGLHPDTGPDTRPDREHHHHKHGPRSDQDGSAAQEHNRLPEPGWLRKENQGEGHASAGWLFDDRHVFDYAGLYQLLCGTQFDRLKAVMLTERGCYAFNQADGVMTVRPVENQEPVQYSRLEAISAQASTKHATENSDDAWGEFERGLLCTMSSAHSS